LPGFFIFIWNGDKKMEIDLLDEFSKFESRLTKIETEIENVNKKHEKNYSFSKEEYLYSEGKKYICINFSQNKPCLKTDTIRAAGFDICISDDNKVCPMLLELS